MTLLIAGTACSVLVKPEEAQCWCGEQWTVQISGAKSYGIGGESWSISASDTTYTSCVTQLEHLALEAADLEDPLYTALHDSLESAAIAKCESAGIDLWGVYFSHTDCAQTGTTPVDANFLHAGACWKSEDFDADRYCPLFPQCEPYYDCSIEPIWDGGDDDVGEEVLWQCEQSVDLVSRYIL